MKKHSCLFAVFALITFCFVSCGGFNDETASVTFNVPEQLFKNITARNGDDGYEEPRELVYIEVTLTGTYTETQTVSFPMDWEAINSTDGKNEFKFLETKQIVFNAVPVGSTVKAKMTVYMLYNDMPDVQGMQQQKSLCYRGSSETITVKGGENSLTVTLQEPYAEYSAEFILRAKDTITASDTVTEKSISVLAVKADSDLYKKFKEHFGNGTADQDDINSLWNLCETDRAGWINLTEEENNSTEGSSSNELKLTGSASLLRDEKTVFIAILNLGLNNIYTGCSSVINTEEIPESGLNITMDIYKLSKQPVYALYQKKEGYDSETYTVNLSTSLDSSYTPIENLETTKCTFDSEGNWYGISSIDASNGSTTILSNRFDNPVTLQGICSSERGPWGITVDTCNSMDIFYFYTANEMQLTIYRFPDLISSNGENTGHNEYNINEGNMHNQVFIYNNSCYDFYDISENDNTHKCTVYNFSQQENGITESASFEINNLVEELTKILQNDAFVKDNCIYFIGSDYSTNTENPNSDEEILCSRGMLVSYNLLTKEVKSSGYNAQDTIIKEFNAEIRVNNKELYIENTGKIYSDTYTNKTIYFKAPYGSSYYDENELNSYFVGPQKIIAVKPKSLVILDTGVAFFTDAEGLLSKRNINRVVEINLEKLSMETAVKNEISSGYVISDFPETKLNNFEVYEERSGLMYWNESGEYKAFTGSAYFVPFIREYY